MKGVGTMFSEGKQIVRGAGGVGVNVSRGQAGPTLLTLGRDRLC